MPTSRSADPLVSARDVLGVATLGLTRLVAALPPSSWRTACRAVAWPLAAWRSRRPARARALRPEVASVSVQARLLAGELESLVLMARLLAAPAWRPDVVLQGREHLDAALARRHGAVLWVHRFQPFVHLVALGLAGFRVTRPSNQDHGHFARSRFGARFFNDVQLRAEGRYCQRIVVAPGELAPLRLLARRLTANEVVAMYADRRGPRSVDLPVLGGVVTVGTAPAALADHAGAALLPVFPLAEARRAFRVVVEAPLPVAGGRAAVDAALRSHAPTLERYVRACPDQWRGWSRTPHDGASVWRPVSSDPARDLRA